MQTFSGPERADPAEQAKPEREYDEFISSIKETKQNKKYPVCRDRYPSSAHPKKEIKPAAFDPNTADSAIFLSLGSSTWMADNILRYHGKQGRPRRPEDSRKVCGLTEKQYQTLQLYIRVAEAPVLQDTSRILVVRATVPYDTLMKYPPGTIIGLNQVDTTELKKIPGIGSQIARPVVDRRRLLGGLYQIEQLGEARLKAEKLRSWFSMDAGKIHRININKASVERMVHHPYTSYYQARAIAEYRKKRREVRDLEQLMLYKEFIPADFERMAPHVCYD